MMVPMMLLVVAIGSSAQPILVSLESADEGMSSWRHVLCEYFAIAIHLNASVVEPCVTSGRINPCNQAGAQPISMLFNLAKIKHQFRLPFASHESLTELVRVSPNRVARWSVHAGNPPRREPSLHQATWREFVDKTKGVDVLILFSFRKFSRCTAALSATKSILQSMLTFADAHSETVDRFKKRLFGTRPYAAVHWRSEQTCRNYYTCSLIVLKAKEHLCLRQPHLCPPLGPPVLLISDLTENYSASSWIVMRAFLNATHQRESANDAYTRLTSPSGFVKVDELLRTDEERFSNFRPIWDLLMGAQANVLLTCDHYCMSESLCSQCAYKGNFARQLNELRRNLNKSATHCW
jgi:hypothetical protein